MQFNWNNDRFFLKMIDANNQSKSGQENIKYSQY